MFVPDPGIFFFLSSEVSLEALVLRGGNGGDSLCDLCRGDRGFWF